MSHIDFVTVLFLLCGKGQTQIHFDCYLQYVNCIVNDKRIDIDIKIETCKKKREENNEDL
jgi:hypothetical protein